MWNSNPLSCLDKPVYLRKNWIHNRKKKLVKVTISSVFSFRIFFIEFFLSIYIYGQRKHFFELKSFINSKKCSLMQVNRFVYIK